MIRRTVALLIVVLLSFALLVTAVWAADKFTWPIGGEVIKRFDLDEHRGIDIAGSAGASIVAAQDGVVYWIGKTPRGEPCISIDHPGGLTTTYLPVTASVSKGQSVKAGDVIGTLSSEIDKSSSEQHLHFGLFETATRDDKKYLDPSNYLPDISSKTEDKHESAAAIEVSSGSNVSGSNVEKLPESQEQSAGNVEARPATNVQPQQQVAMSPVDVAEKPAENARPEIRSSLIVPNAKASEGVVPDTIVNQRQIHSERQAGTGMDMRVERSLERSISSVKKIPRDTAKKVGLQNLSWVAPEVKPGLISAVNYGTHTARTASAQASQKPVKIAGECAKSKISIIGRVAPIKRTGKMMPFGSTTSAKKAYINQPALNPFEHAISVKHPAAHIKGEIQLGSRATKPSNTNTWAQRLLNWQFLPTTTSVLAMLLIAIISYQCARTARRIGPSLSSVTSPSC